MTSAHSEKEMECERLACRWPPSEKAALDALLENVSDVIIVASPEGRIRYVNRPLPESADDELVGSCVFDLIGEEHRQDYWDVYQDAIESRDVCAVEVKSAGGRWWRCRIIPSFEGGAVTGAMVICTDTTKGKEAEDALRGYEQFLEQTLDSHERLRESLADEIQEDIAQVIAGALVHLRVLVRRQVENGEERGEILGTVETSLGASLARLRKIANLLRPPVLGEFGVVPAITCLIAEHDARNTCGVELSQDPAFDRLPPHLESAVFRIAQELLMNACRHSGSEKVQVELGEEDSRVRIEVQDWGVGFDPERIPDDCRGLQEVRMRTRLLGGEAAIDSAPGQGTRVTVRLPTGEKRRAKQRAGRPAGPS